MANTTPNESSSAQTSSVIPPLLGGNQTASFGISLTQTPAVKLDRSNFLLWKNMVLPIIKGHNLEGFILGTNECPSETIATQTTTEAGATVELSQNSEYRKWMSIDQLLMGWLYSSMTPEFVVRVMGSIKSSELWKATQESFGVLNKSRVTFLIGELQKTRKGAMSIDQYLGTIKQ